MGVTAKEIWDAAYSTAALIRTYLGTDEKQDTPPVKSSIYDIAATDHNRIVGGLSDCALRLRNGNISVLSWSHPNVATGGPTHAYRDGDTAVTESVAPFAGKVIGIGVALENPVTVGTVDINVEINGTPITITCQLDSVTNTQYVYVAQLPEVADAAGDEFSAGDRIEVTWTATTLTAGATPSIAIDLYVAIGE